MNKPKRPILSSIQKLEPNYLITQLKELLMKSAKYIHASKGKHTSNWQLAFLKVKSQGHTLNEHNFFTLSHISGYILHFGLYLTAIYKMFLLKNNTKTAHKERVEYTYKIA